MRAITHPGRRIFRCFPTFGPRASTLARCGIRAVPLALVRLAISGRRLNAFFIRFVCQAPEIDWFIVFAFALDGLEPLKKVMLVLIFPSSQN
jgi:hypothetical protein